MTPILRGAGFVAVLALAALVPPRTAMAEWVTKSVHGYQLGLSVETQLDAASSYDPKHAPVMEHRVVVSVRDPQSAQPVQISALSIDVAEEGYEGVVLPMRRIETGPPAIYEARVRLRRGVSHRLLVHAMRAGGARTLEAQFEYRHHH